MEFTRISSLLGGYGGDAGTSTVTTAEPPSQKSLLRRAVLCTVYCVVTVLYCTALYCTVASRLHMARARLGLSAGRAAGCGWAALVRCCYVTGGGGDGDAWSPHHHIHHCNHCNHCNQPIFTHTFVPRVPIQTTTQAKNMSLNQGKTSCPYYNVKLS